MSRLGIAVAPSAETPPDTRPTALALGGLRRGALLVFLPVAAAGQAIAWFEYAISGRYRPGAWLEIGMAYTLTAVRVPFDALVLDDPTARGASAVEGATMELALGALTIAVVVLAFRAGIAQARGLERQPRACALAGSAVGLGFALPMAVGSLFVRLAFPGFGITLLEPGLAMALLLPLVVGAAMGAVGGLAAASRHREERAKQVDHDPNVARAPDRLEAAGRGGFEAFWWGLGLAFVAFLVLAVVETGATRAYGRTIGAWDEGGAVVVVHHALLLPNQSAMILAVTMGSPVDLAVGDERAARISLEGVEAFGSVADLLPARAEGWPGVTFPAWYRMFLLVPAIATVLGGRRAAEHIRPSGERALRGALGGVVFAVLCGIAAWASGIVLPLLVDVLGGEPSIGADPFRTTLVALAWGVAGGVVGALLPLRPRRAQA